MVTIPSREFVYKHPRFTLRGVAFVGAVLGATLGFAGATEIFGANVGDAGFTAFLGAIVGAGAGVAIAITDPAYH